MDKDFATKMGKMVLILIPLIKCASEKCSKEKNNASANKEIIEKYNQYKLEENKATKLKILGELNDNKIIYELNICVIKNCKKMVKDIVKMIKNIVDIVPKNTEKSEKLQKLITNIENIIKSPKLTEKQYKIHIKNINDILATFN